MFQEFYGLDKDAFSLSPDLDFLFLSSVHEEAIAHLAYGLEQKEDLILIAGDIGTGKTLALHRLLAQISQSVVPVSINVTTIGFEELLRLVLLKLVGGSGAGQPVANMIHELETELVRLRKTGKTVLLTIDEAQNLSVEQLESIRLLLNLAQPGGSVLQIVLAGQLGLVSTLDLPQMRQLRQRIKVAYTFGNLNRQETEEYILHRLNKVGREKPLFKKDALEKIYQMSGGVPRVVNYLASKALLSGYVDQAAMISGKYIEESAAEGRKLLAEEDPVGGSGLTPAVAPIPIPVEGPESPARAAPMSPETSAGDSRPSRRGRWAGAIVATALLIGFAAITYQSWAPYLLSAVERTLVREEPVESVSAAPQAGSVAQAGPSPDSGEPVGLVEEPVAVPMDTAAIANRQPAEVAPAPVAVAAAVDSFVVHVASFQDRERARHFRIRLVNDGWDAYVQSSPVTYGRTWHRVYLGPFPGREKAVQAVEELKAAGIISYSQIAHR